MSLAGISHDEVVTKAFVMPLSTAIELGARVHSGEDKDSLFFHNATRQYREKSYRDYIAKAAKHPLYDKGNELDKTIIEALFSTMIEINSPGRGMQQTIHSTGCAAPAFARRLHTHANILRNLQLEIDVPSKPNSPDCSASESPLDKEETKIRIVTICQLGKTIGHIRFSNTYIKDFDCNTINIVGYNNLKQHTDLIVKVFHPNNPLLPKELGPAPEFKASAPRSRL